jgi:CRP-like cAMP-binding protein
MSEESSNPSLPASHWMGALRQDDRDLLSSYGEFIPAYAGQAVIREGTEQDNFYFVVSGKLEVRRSGALGEQIVAYIAPGEAMGEVCMFDPGPASATVVPTEFSQLWRINRDELLSFINDNPGAGAVLLLATSSILAQRLRLSGHADTHSPAL